MLTQEQIQNLKPGDKLALSHPLIFREYDSENDELLAINNGEYIYFHAVDVELPSKHGTSLSRRSSVGAETEVPTKYDPCRLFKKGDIVEIDTHGRDIAASMKKSGVELGKRYTVTENENNTGYISFIGDDGIEHHSMFFWLKLVTPVEELEPYLMLENVPSNSIEVRDKRTNKVEATFYFGKDHAYTFEQAATRAEAERDRLNAEWRKEHGND